MNLLFIASGYLPYTFSENLCNAKLVYAMQSNGWNVDVISRQDNGIAYRSEWSDPWLPLRDHTFEVRYEHGSVAERMYDIAVSAFLFRLFPVDGIRWMRRALSKAIELCGKNQYDAILTRAPNDIAHYVGYALKHRTGIRWIANWNDPADPIWPEPYTNRHSFVKQRLLMRYTANCLKTADINTFPSDFLRKHFESCFPFFRDCRTEVVPHIAMPEKIWPHIESGKNSKLMLCHSGNLSCERNPENLFHAMRELVDEGYNQMQFDIMGRINDYTRTLIHKYKLEEYVSCSGSFPYLDAIRQMSRYDVMVLVEAILEKGIFFPSKLTDYAQLKKPILALSPADGFVHDLLQKYGGGIYADNTDYQAIKIALKKLYSSWSTGDLSTAYSTGKMYKYFSADSVMKLYKKVLS